MRPAVLETRAVRPVPPGAREVRSVSSPRRACWSAVPATSRPAGLWTMTVPPAESTATQQQQQQVPAGLNVTPDELWQLIDRAVTATTRPLAIKLDGRIDTLDARLDTLDARLGHAGRQTGHDRRQTGHDGRQTGHAGLKAGHTGREIR